MDQGTYVPELATAGKALAILNPQAVVLVSSEQLLQLIMACSTVRPETVSPRQAR